MPNDNTFAALVNQPQQFVATTAETLLVGSTGTALVQTLPPDRGFKSGRSFIVHLIGKATGGTGATAQFKLYLGTALSGSLVCAFTVSGAAVPAAGGNFDLKAELTWDSVSGLINGSFSGQTNNTLTSRAAITQQTAITSTSQIQFVPSVTFGAGLATQSVTVSEFSFEQV